MSSNDVPPAFRYPGSKLRIAPHIFRHFPPEAYMFDGCGLSAYCEPFVGCGAIAMKFLPDLVGAARVYFADADPGVAAYWRAVRREPLRLCELVRGVRATPKSFRTLKDLDGQPTGDDAVDGFRKWALHTMSFSGLGAKAGSPIGGWNQDNPDYDITARLRPYRQMRVVVQQHKLLARFAHFECRTQDFLVTLGSLDEDAFAYLDPPYVEKGNSLYAVSMSPGDHERLAGALRVARYKWVLSYDDHPLVRQLYESWACVETFEMTATIDAKSDKPRRKNNELVITPRPA